jgi:dihydrofolate reductase
LPADLKFFKRVTLGHPILMGRTTYEAIGRPLPGRLNLVLSRQPSLNIEGCTVVGDLAAAIAASGAADELMVIGGADVYRQTIERAERIYLTRVHATIAGDTFFPPLEWAFWKEISVERHAADERHAYAYSFIELRREPPAVSGDLS